MRCISLIAALCFSAGPALGLSFSAPLPDLVGVVDSRSFDGKDANFDFGQQFSEIENVWIEIQARVFAREFDVCGTVFDPQPCVHVVQLLGFLAIMEDQEGSASGSIFSEGLSFGDFRALEGYGVDTEVFYNSSIGWEFLLDGEGSLTLYWNNVFGHPDRIFRNRIPPSGEIFNARLIIEGTPIPEPSTALLVAAGLTVLAVSKPRNGCVIVVNPHRK